MAVYDNDPNKTFWEKQLIKKGVDPDIASHPKKATQEQQKEELSALENNQKAIDEELGLNNENQFYKSNEQTTGIADRIKGYTKNNPKKVVGAGGGITLLLSAIFLAIVGLGPLQLIHFAEVLQGIHFGDSDVVSSQRLRNLIVYSKWIKTGDGLEDTRLGVIEAHRAGKIDARLEKSGLTSQFDNGKFTGFEIDQSKLPDNVRQELKGLNKEKDPDGKKRAKVYANHFGTSTSDISYKDGKIKIKVEGTRNSRMLLSNAMKMSPNFNKASAAYSKRILIKRANISWNPITRVKEAAKTKSADKYKEFRENRQKKYAGEKIDTPVPKNDEQQAKDGETEAQKKAREAANAALSEVSDTADGIQNGELPSDELKSKISVPKGTAAAGGALIAIGLICTADQMSGDIADAQMMGKVGPAMQAAAEYAGTASKVKDGGDVDLETVGVLSENLNGTKAPAGKNLSDEEALQYSALGGNAMDASTIQKEQGQVVKTRTLDEEAVRDSNPDEKSNIASIADAFAATKGVPGVGQTLSAVCGVYNTFDAFAGTMLNTLTFGASDKLSAIIMGPIFSMLTGQPPDVLAEKYKGKAFGEIVSLGFLYVSNETNLAMGQGILTEEQRNEMKTYSAQQLALDDSRNIFQKSFDINNPNSAGGKFASNLYSKPNFATLSSIPSGLINNLSQTLGLKAGASEQLQIKDSDYYGVPKVSIPVGILNNPDFENPYENIVKTKKILDSDSDLKEFMEKCNGITITDELDFQTKSADEDVVGGYLKSDSECKDKKYTAYQLDNINSGELQNKNIASRINSFFNKKAVASKSTPTLTEKQTNYARLMIAATDTMLLKAHSCLEYDDEESCNEISGTQGQGEDTVSKEGAFIQGDYAWPVGIFKKDVGGSELPCPTSPPYCHHDGSPALDLTTKKAASGSWEDAEGKPVYAITNGTMNLSRQYHSGVPSYCYQFHLKGDDGLDYYYTHIRDPIVKEGDQQKVKVGDKIAVIADDKCTVDSSGGGHSYPHLHIDATNGDLGHSTGSRVVELLKIINKLYENLPDSAPTVSETITEGVEVPPNLGDEIGQGYYRMPPPKNGTYIFNEGTPPDSRCGSKELISVLYTAALNWKSQYPDNPIKIGDMNAGEPHKSHKWGVAVDIYVQNGNAAVAGNGNLERNKDLAKAFLDTDQVQQIWFTDSNMASWATQYAKDNKLHGRMDVIPNHETHFHVDVLDEYKLNEMTSCPGN